MSSAYTYSVEAEMRRDKRAGDMQDFLTCNPKAALFETRFSSERHTHLSSLLWPLMVEGKTSKDGSKFPSWSDATIRFGDFNEIMNDLQIFSEAFVASALYELEVVLHSEDADFLLFEHFEKNAKALALLRNFFTDAVVKRVSVLVH